MSNLGYFTEEEVYGLDPRLVEKLNEARAAAGVPFVLTSRLRESGKAHGDHDNDGDGEGVDIGCHDSHTRNRIIVGLLYAGFTRYGIYDSHIHADIREDLPQHVTWIGWSK
jgi:hypothetical protein